MNREADHHEDELEDAIRALAWAVAHGLRYEVSIIERH